MYKDLLMKIFDYDESSLDRIVELIIKAKKMFNAKHVEYGFKMFMESFQDDSQTNFYDIIYYLLCSASEKLLAVDELDTDYVDRLARINFLDPDFRFSEKLFEGVQVEEKHKNVLIRQFNEFLEK